MSTTNPFQVILAKYRKYAFSEHDKGMKFERLMQAYLQTDPQYSNRFSEVWLWSEFPARRDFGGADIGIDLVARTFDGEYWAIYVFNLRGNQRTSGELSRKEGGKIFGSGSRTPIAITFLIKNPKSKAGKATIHYYDIGDYLSREDKLSIIKKFGSVENSGMMWKTLKPNEHGDWLNQRDDLYESFIPIAPEKKFSLKNQSFFLTQSLGTATNRDSWVYNFSRKELGKNIELTISHYNHELTQSIEGKINEPRRDSKKGNWTRDWLNQFKRKKPFIEETNEFRITLYRPFTVLNSYFADDLNQERYQLPKLFPEYVTQNRVISICGLGISKDFSAIITDKIPDLQLQPNGQVFPLFHFEEKSQTQGNLFDAASESKYTRRDAITDFILKLAQKAYGNRVTKEDIFYYVYGFLHSPEYRSRFANDLKKTLPRIPLVEQPKDFWAFSKAGRQLAELHIGYESVPPAPGVVVHGEESEFFKVQKMRFPKKGQTDTILYNSRIKVSNIPDRAYEYIVNGKSAIEWVMERYQVKVDKASGIKNDPNDWATEVGNPRYILDLLLSVINVSLQTVEIVEELPEVGFE